LEVKAQVMIHHQKDRFDQFGLVLFLTCHYSLLVTCGKDKAFSGSITWQQFTPCDTFKIATTASPTG